MEATGKRGKRERARLFCLSLIHKAGRSDTPRLPTIQAMARECGVSHVTMMRAVRELAEQGVLESKQGAGIRAIAPYRPAEESRQTEAKPAPDSRLLWERVADRIRDRIRSGTYGLGSRLPGKKVLCETYGVSPPTINKVLRFLEREKAIHRDRTHYFVPGDTHGTRNGCVVFVFRGRKEIVPETFTPRMKKIFRIIEQTCLARNLQFVPAPIHFVAPSRHVSPSSWVNDLQVHVGDRPIIGFIFWNYSMGNVDFDSFLRAIVRFRRPVSFLHETYPRTVPGVPRGLNQFLRVDTADDREVGREVGRYLRSRGVSDVAYLAFNQDIRWQVERHRGIAQEMPADTRGGSFHCPEPGIAFKQVDSHAPELRTTIPSLCRLGDLPDSPHWLSPQVFSRYRANISTIVYQWRIVYALYPLVKRILRDAAPRVIVGCNDTMALGAHMILRLPEFTAYRDIGIIGFDDTEEALLNGFSSYNFNDEGFVMAALEFVLQPESALFRNTSTVQTHGFLSTREY